MATQAKKSTAIKQSKTSEDNPTSSSSSSQTPATTETQTKNSQPFLKPDEARTAFEESWRWYRVYMDPLDEFERLARNRPSPSIDPTLPRVTDGTLSAIIQETPKRIIQQVPTGFVISKDNPDLAPIADIILREKLLLNYNRMGNLIQKSWNMISKSMTYGMASSYTFFTKTNGVFHTDFIIPYAKDNFGERGKVFMPDSNVRFLRSWYQKRDLQAIISREIQLEKTVKGYKTPWNLKMLQKFMDSGVTAKPAYLMTPAEKEKGGETGGYEMITVFQKGIGAEFYTFAPRFSEDVNLCVKENLDPRGALPIDDQYCNIDLSNPLGRGQVELSGGIQNLMDQQMQLYQFMQTIMQGPPLQTWGNVNKASLKYRPNAIWDMGSSANNKVEPVVVDGEQIKSFVTNMQFLAGKINNINATQDASVGASSGATSAQSKTQAGVEQSQQRLGVSDNYLQQMSEGWFGRHCETSLNLYFANMKGKETMDIGEQDLKDLQATVAAKNVKTDKNGNSKLTVNYNDIEKVVFRFKVNAGTSKKVEDEEQLAKLQQAIQEIGSNGRVMAWYLGQEGKKLQVGDIYKQSFERMGLQNLDTILVDMTPEEAQAAKQQPYPLFDMPKLSADYKDLPPSAAVGFLAGAGINVNPQEVMQQPVVDPNARGQAGATGGTNPADAIIPTLHPALQAIKAMGWQLDDLPPDTQKYVLGLMNLPAEGMSTAELNARTNATKASHDIVDNHAKTALEVAKTAHNQGIDTHKTAMADVPQQYQPQDPSGNSDPENAADQASEPNGEPANEPQQPQVQQQPAGVGDITQHAPISPQEQAFAHELIKRGFSDQDIEQAIVMVRQGMPPAQVIQTIGAKYAPTR